LKFTEKIHTIKHFIKYACQSKSKFRVHSPFVFSFILDILEYKSPKSGNLYRKIDNYYTNISEKMSIQNNAGAGSVVLANNQKINLTSFIKKVGLPYKYGIVLENIAEKYACSNNLELGTSLGISTSFLAANPNNQLTTIEANPFFYNNAKQAFTTIKRNNITFVNALFEDILPQIGKEKQFFSLIFIDGDHTLKATLDNFNTIKAYLNENSIVILDDIYWSREMTQAWEIIKKDKDVTLSIDLFRIGIVFFRKEIHQKEDFVLWY